MRNGFLTLARNGFVCFFVGIFLLSVCFSTAEVAAESVGLRIDSIKVGGNQNISKAKVLTTVRARVGEIFDKKSAEEDAGRLAKIEGVEYAYYNIDTQDGAIKLTYVIVEKRVVRSIVFIGNVKVKDGKLSREVGFKSGDYLDSFMVASGGEAIKDIYVKKGYAFIGVTLDQTRLASGDVVYTILEGPRVKVRKVTVAGNEAVSTKDLARAMKTKKRKFFFWPVYYNGETLKSDTGKLQEVFQERGYLDARVDVTSEFSEDNKFVEVTFTVNEGPIYVVDSVILKGNKFFSSNILSEGLKLRAGEFYSKDKSYFDVRTISRKYREIGFIDVNVEHARTFSGKGKVFAEFTVAEGERFRIGEITITGNEATHDKVVRRILDEEHFRPGEWYDGEVSRGDGRGDLERLVGRSVFAESTVIQAVGNKANQRDVQVNITEGQTGSIMVGAGVASNSGIIGQLVYDERNFDIFNWPDKISEIFGGEAFRGAGQRLRVSIEPGTVQDSFSISFTEPYLYDKPVSFDVVASSFERRRDGYDEKRSKGYVGVEKRYDDDWRRGVSFRIENVEATDIDIDAPKEIADIEGDNILSGIKLYIRKDTTNSRFLPSNGYNFVASYEQVAGDYTYGVASGTQRWYRTLYEDLAERKTVLETKLYAASIVGGDAPPFEKFYAGGSGSIRGFDYRGVSTRGLQRNVPNPEYKDPIGSDWIVTGNAEVAVPLSSEVISALFFVDAGVIDTGGVRASVGGGLQILLPQWFGPVPMRFEFAVPLVQDDLDETEVFSFTVGALF
jgi:outer membrane protein insertion porin family